MMDEYLIVIVAAANVSNNTLPQPSTNISVIPPSVTASNPVYIQDDFQAPGDDGVSNNPLPQTAARIRTKHHKLEKAKAVHWAEKLAQCRNIVRYRVFGFSSGCLMTCETSVETLYCLHCSLSFCCSCVVHHEGLYPMHVTTNIHGEVREGELNSPESDCSCTNDKPVTVFLPKGIKTFRIKRCSHSDMFMTLLDNGLWPFTPVVPNYAMDLGMMEAAYRTRTVSRISLQKFFYTYEKTLTDLPIRMPSVDLTSVYSIAREAFYQYDVLMSDELTVGGKCPVCFSQANTGPLIFSVDACFQLKRKHASGKEHRKPLFSDVFVEALVEDTPAGQDIIQTCNHRAGDQSV
jgi:hypothetical protein